MSIKKSIVSKTRILKRIFMYLTRIIYQDFGLPQKKA